LAFNITFKDNASLSIQHAPDLELTTLALALDLIPTWQADTGHIALVPQVPPAGLVTLGAYNWNDAPDWLIDYFDDPKTLIADATTKVMGPLGAHLKALTESLFFQFMGGLFDFTPTIQRTDQACVFQFVAGEEDPVGTLNPFYHFGAPLTLNPHPAAARLVAASVEAPTPVGTTAGSANKLATGPVHHTPMGLGGPKPNWHSPNLAKIDHIVVLMKENRSFDHVLGHLSLTGNRPDVDGLTPPLIDSFPIGSRPRPFPLVPVSAEFPPDLFPFDPDHSYDAVAREINNPGGPAMRGFIPQFLTDYPWLSDDAGKRLALHPPIPSEFMPFQQDAIMGYHTPTTVPYYSLLAQSYTVCDRWFSSHPGPTFPNRFFFLSGKLSTQRSGEPQRDNGISGLTLNRHRNLFDELTARGVPWTYYESPPDVTMLRMYARYAFDDLNIRPISEFFARAEQGQLPAVTFIDPNFHFGQTTNDDHPPTSISGGQAIVQEIVEALQTNRAAWRKTLFVFTYDEHGSIFDHVVPPIAETLKDSSSKVDIAYGVRVPAIVVSPWVEKRCAHQVYDHCSILKTILARFCSDDPAILSDRVAFAADLGPLLTRSFVSEALEEQEGVPNVNKAAAVPKDGPGLVAHGKLAAPQLAKPRVPLPRAATLSRPNTDWHSFMARLKQFVKP
jgi:phospholipase C